MDRHRIRKLGIGLLQYGVSLSILAYLVWDAQRDETFSRLIDEPKHWGLLGAAFALCMFSSLLTIVRWYVLVRALDIPFDPRNAFRLWFLGYLFNFISFGAVGGDVIKAFLLAREQPNHRAEAVATVLIDRVIGLYALLLLASCSIIGFGAFASPQSQVRVICQATLLVTLLMTAGLTVLMLPVVARWTDVPKVLWSEKLAHVVRRMVGALAIYRRRPMALVQALLYSFAVHIATTIGIYLIALGLPGASPTFAEHLVIVPMTLATGVLPLPGGLGAFEGALDFLYQAVSAGQTVAPRQGLLVALVFRVITIVIALVGVVFYIMNRRELAEALARAESEEAAAEEELEHAECSTPVVAT
ncbi:MAG TPA: lysylphosphatidylglycerol synthase transmembrane domain-containing protein [Pirellulales bacterium]|nr:lysylphosphatidylglycerol synthase transmembrane domain-containing protein [Pirellulales bacterium]